MNKKSNYFFYLDGPIISYPIDTIIDWLKAIFKNKSNNIQYDTLYHIFKKIN